MEWEKRTAQIKGEGGEIFFEQHDCEIPATWSQLATNVVASKYLYGEVGTPERETGVRQLVHRVCRTISDWGIRRRLFRLQGRRRTILPRFGLSLPAPVRLVQFAGVVQRRIVSPVRRQRGDVQLVLGRRRGRKSVSPRILTNTRKVRPALSKACGTTWKTSWSLPAARRCCSNSDRARARIFRLCGRIGKDFPAAAGHRDRCRSCGCTIKSPRWSKAAARRGGRPKCNRSRIGIPT